MDSAIRAKNKPAPNHLPKSPSVMGNSPVLDMLWTLKYVLKVKKRRMLKNDLKRRIKSLGKNRIA